ncbi:MAG: DAK2 domain-containing protein [Nitriliruptoraceae bacterium]
MDQQRSNGRVPAVARRGLSIRQLGELFDGVATAIEQRRGVIDELNVFPVPDGDTGTNMSLTIHAARPAAHAGDGRLTPGSAGSASVVNDVVRALVRGARGNSGVIISQILRGIVEPLADGDIVSGTDYAHALGRARDLAYRAVADPVEGTMLTAVAAAAAAAAEAAEAAMQPIESVSRVACDATSVAVERTPEQLDVLRHAGVVDAGARGFEVVLAAVHAVIAGEVLTVKLDHPRVFDRHDELATTSGAFEVQYVLTAPDASVDQVRGALEGLGDSVAVVAAGDMLNIHVHTDVVDDVLAVGASIGTVSEINVVAFEEHIAQRQALHSHIGAVALLPGSLLAQVVCDTGAYIISGGSGALPSVAQFADAIRTTGARRVVVLPGHRNAVAAAHHAASIASDEGFEVEVVAATTPLGVLAALSVFDPHLEFDVVRAEMEAAAGGVSAIEIVGAVRSADTPFGPVACGQPMVVNSVGEVIAVAADLDDAIEQGLDALGDARAEVVTIMWSSEVDARHRSRLGRAVASRHPTAELDVIDAGDVGWQCWIGLE